MTTASRQTELDRAYVQSRVIETGLQRLAASLSSVDVELRDDLCEYAHGFDRYVRRLRDAHSCAEDVRTN
jgi:hypothetical protein